MRKSSKMIENSSNHEESMGSELSVIGVKNPKRERVGRKI